MSDILGSYAFLDWLRRGAATQIMRVDGDPGNAPRATFPVTLGFNSDSLTASATLELYGPGEVTGIDAGAIIRTWPRRDEYDAEANYLPLVEFDQADMPWRYTPAAANARSRLHPWIVLVVVTEDEIESYQAPTRSQPLPIVKIKSAASLPDLGQSWAWAHVQVSGRKTITPDDAASLFATAPHVLLSRLVSPRQMQPKNAYRGLVVPALERGRRAGLSQSTDGVDALARAWASNGASIELPVYYEWRFQTGVAGDFEYLVRLLKARPMPPTVGVRPMDVRTPDPTLPPAQNEPMLLEGALQSPAVPARTWNAAERATFVTAVRKLLNLPAQLLRTGGTKIVVPPLYGRWHAARDIVDAARGPDWFVAVNDDPRDRVAAGLGTLVIQDQQEKLMASAWQQVGRIREINEKLRQAQVARESATRLYERHVKTAANESLLMFASPVFTRVKGSRQTIAKLMEDSPIGRGVFEPQFRRVVRSRGPVGRRQKRTDAKAGTAGLLQRMNDGKLQPSEPLKSPSSMVTPSRATGLVPNWLTDSRLRGLEKLPFILVIIAVVLTIVAVFGIVFGASVVAAIAAAAAIAALAGRGAIHRWVARLRVQKHVASGKLMADDVRSAPQRPGFTLVPEVGPSAPPPPQPPAGTALPSAHDSADAAAFRTAVADMFAQMRSPRVPAKELRQISISDVRDKLVTALDPKTTIAASIVPRLEISSAITWKYGLQDPLEPIMAAPEFDQPMYEPLRDLSQDWLLPGLDRVPPNTISLLVTNQAFVEGYMLGLNHEMGRELLWREYPTDQRGTYFRQFWDVRGYVGSADPDSLRDIKRLPWANALGHNSPRPPLPANAEHLVLLIRGDLLLRYPTAVVYAVKARRVGHRRELTDPPVELHPVFRGTLKPDVSFFGFELTPDQAAGQGGDSPDQGWFFVIQEHPAEPRFGFDFPTYPPGPLTTWNDLNWAHFAADAKALSAITYINLDSALPDTRNVVAEPGEPAAVWHADGGTGPKGARASDIAYITLQRPVRIAVHGTDMLP